MQVSNDKIPVAIVGANGYSGQELARLLLKHPKAQLTACLGRNQQWSLEDELFDEGVGSVPTLALENLSQILEKNPALFQTVFLATPPEVSLELAPLFLQKGIHVIDLSGAFRLDAGSFHHWYQLPHSAESYLSKAIYGLRPWCQSYPGILPYTGHETVLISNPGCYATSVLMALLPLLQKGIIDPTTLVIDAKSGTSGAGLKAKENLLFNEVDGDCLPYRVGRHQHLPEIIHYAEVFSGVKIDPHFSTSLLPLRRGIISALYAKLTPMAQTSGIVDLLDQIFAQAYEGYPLMQFGRLGQSEKRDKKLLSLKKVAGTCRTHISYQVTNDKIYIFSTIDNLLKGAASQAVENWNALLGLPLETGLMNSEGLL